MAAPTIGRRPFAPPVGARVDWSHPLAQRLDTCVLPGRSYVDLVTGRRPDTTTGTATRTGAQAGPAAFINGATADRIEWSATAKPCFAPPFSVLLVASQPPGASSYAIAYGGRGSGKGWSFGRETFAALTFGGVAVYEGSANWGVGPLGVHALATVDANGGTARLYDRGTQIHSATIGTLDTGAGTGFMIGCAYLGGYTVAYTGGVVAAMVWKRVITAAEAAELAADPFCMLRY